MSGLSPNSYDAVAFDLLTALLNSWSVWDGAANSREFGRRWRVGYLKLTYGCGAYRPYEDLVAEAAADVGLGAQHVAALVEQWSDLRPWPEVPEILAALGDEGLALGVVTNCSTSLGRRAADSLSVSIKAVVTAEEVGFYKPRPEPYQALLDQLGTDPARTLFVAGSPADVPGASRVGMPVLWHNRVALPFPQGEATPILVADTLDPLMELVR